MVQSVAFRIMTLLHFLLSLSHIIWNKKQICFPACTKNAHIFRHTLGSLWEENKWGKRHQAWTAVESGIQGHSLHTTKDSIHTRKAGTIVYLHSNALHVIIHYAKHDKHADLVIFIYIIVVCRERAPPGGQLWCLSKTTTTPKLPFQPLVKGHIVMTHLCKGCINTVCRERH